MFLILCVSLLAFIGGAVHLVTTKTLGSIGTLFAMLAAILGGAFFFTGLLSLVSELKLSHEHLFSGF